MRLFTLLPIALLLFGCGLDGDGNGDGGTAPAISNLYYSPTSAHVGDGGGAVTVNGILDFIDPDGDLDFIRVRSRPCGTGDWETINTPISAVSGLTSGSVAFVSVVDTLSCPAGLNNTTQVSTFDEAGHQSNILNAPFELLE